MMFRAEEGILDAVIDPSITDIHVCVDDPRRSLVYPGPRRIDDELLPAVQKILEACARSTVPDFMLSVVGGFFRCRLDVRPVDGVWYSLRRIPPKPPSLDTLPSKLRAPVVRMLLSPKLSSGGLVYIIGKPGSGKTTTASAALVSRLQQYGGFAYTIENPPEMPLAGWHGQGYCRQTWVGGEEEGAWNEAMICALRSMPANTPVMLYVGEIRGQGPAQAMIRAAANGFLVITTGFATDIPSGLDELVRRLGGQPADAAMLASVLRLVVYQQLRDGVLTTTTLASPDAASQVAVKIRSGQYQHLNSDIQYQANKALMGEDVL